MGLSFHMLQHPYRDAAEHMGLYSYNACPILFYNSLLLLSKKKKKIFHPGGPGFHT